MNLTAIAYLFDTEPVQQLSCRSAYSNEPESYSTVARWTGIVVPPLQSFRQELLTELRV